jgi:hypothetical protein
MNQSLKRILILSFIYGLHIFIPAFLGVLISFTAQPGGINQSNAFIAPFLYGNMDARLFLCRRTEKVGQAATL